LRAHARVEKELFAKLGYAEAARRGVLVLETRTVPTDEVAAWVAGKAGGGLEPGQLTFVVAPTASLAGGVQIAARVLETGLHKMDTLGFDLKKIVSAIGTAPLPPVAKSDLRAIGRTNDCILYGGRARYTVNADQYPRRPTCRVRSSPCPSRRCSWRRRARGSPRRHPPCSGRSSCCTTTPRTRRRSRSTTPRSTCRCSRRMRRKSARRGPSS